MKTNNQIKRIIRMLEELTFPDISNSGIEKEYKNGQYQAIWESLVNVKYELIDLLEWMNDTKE